MEDRKSICISKKNPLYYIEGFVLNNVFVERLLKGKKVMIRMILWPFDLHNTQGRE